MDFKDWSPIGFGVVSFSLSGSLNHNQSFQVNGNFGELHH